MAKVRKRKIKLKGILLIVIFLVIIFILFKGVSSFRLNTKIVKYLGSNETMITIYNAEGEESEKLARGTKVDLYEAKTITLNEQELFLIKYDSKEGYIDINNLVDNKNDTVFEKKIYVRTSQNLLSSPNDPDLLALVNKGDELEVIGFNNLKDDGSVEMYEVKKEDITGYIYTKYVVFNYDESLLNYDQDNTYQIHNNREDRYGGGSGGNLDYYPVIKPEFEDNIMPKSVYALYLNGSSNVIDNVDEYIAFAKDTKINAFVVDIKDNASPAYNSKVMQEYSKTNYDHAMNSMESYRNAIQKIKDNGFYVIGRITLFKDEYYAIDHPENAIIDTRTGNLFNHNGTYWPSGFKREVWHFNVELAKEAVKEMGFNEIQFDYVRFPDRTLALENQGYMDFKNIYNETKAQAIQRFLMYATDELHKLNVYVSADVFGESAHQYITAYGQYWPAISNIVDVISAMPYPDHFNKYEYGFTVPVWTVPYDLLNYWGKNYVVARQNEIPTPAIVRTWIQTYNTIREPYIEYGSAEVQEQIQGLFDASLNGGYMTWNSGSNLIKYRSQIEAYNREY